MSKKKFKKKLVNATCLFIDIVNSIELANYWSSTKYNDFLNEFQDRMLTGIDLWGANLKEVKLAGDELSVVFYSEDIKNDIVNAIALATNLKILWYVSTTNLKRISEGKKIIDLGIGINTGKVFIDERPYKKRLNKFITKRKTLEGFAISLAKRLETLSREGKYSKIMVGSDIISELNKLQHSYEFDYKGLQKIKGLAQEIPVFEIKSCYTESAEHIAKFPRLKWIIEQLEHIKMYDPSNIWLYMTLIDIYSNKKNYKKVEQLCKEAIRIDNTVADIYAELADALIQFKKYDDSLKYSDKAISLNPKMWFAYNLKTQALIFLGLYDQSIEVCKCAVENVHRGVLKEEECFYYNIAAAYARKGDKKTALINIKKAIRIGGNETIRYLKKDKDKDFYNLYDDPAFKSILKQRLQ